MKPPYSTIFSTLLLLYTTHSTNAKTNFTTHSTEIHALHHNKALHLNKRDFLTCEQTYGGGSIPCGGGDSKYCYDPTIGESCCMQDYGYCGIGDVCAPIEGYCCHENENTQICMLRLGITQNDNGTPDSDPKGSSSSITSASSSLSASQSQSESESKSEINTEANQDEKSPDSDSDSENSDIDTHSSPPISMLMNAANSGPSSDADAGPGKEPDDENPTTDTAPNSTSGTQPTGNRNPKLVTTSPSLEIAVVSNTVSDTDPRPGYSDIVSALKISTVVLSAASLGAGSAGVEMSVGAWESSAGAPTSAAIQSKSLPGGFIASAPTAGINGSFTGGTLRTGMGRGLGLGLERGMSRGWVVLGVCFVAWGVL
ncbi:hypothetical protein EYC80_005873 [Monilinia laxa]|uniref:Uncharacterized protein n=1 Tax=Monilinia laxa TaxID=61186 RepID=A0A5N6KFK4_MONLA|nr:hypothetical protein EYC80_005873 [Monilinia laxa]